MARHPLKQQILQKLSETDTNKSIIVTDFQQIKIFKVNEFWVHPEQAFDFLENKPSWAFLVDNGGDVSYDVHQKEVTLVTDFFTPDFTERWKHEMELTHKLQSCVTELDILNAYNAANVQAIGTRNGFLCFCHKHNAYLHYARFDKYSHIFSDDLELVKSRYFKPVWVNTSPTLINLKDYTIFRVETY